MACMRYTLPIVASLLLTTVQAQTPVPASATNPIDWVQPAMPANGNAELKPVPGVALIKKTAEPDLDGLGFYYLLLGFLYEGAGQMEDSAQAFSQALRHIGDEALLLELTKNTKATVTGLHFDAIQATPQEKEMLTAIASGIALLSVDSLQLDATIQRMLLEVEETPRLSLASLELRLFYAQKLLSLQKNDAARSELVVLANRSPKNPKIWYTLASLDKDAKRWKQALTHSEKALSLPLNPAETLQSQTLVLYMGLESPEKSVQKKAYALLRPLLKNPNIPLDLLAPLSILAQKLEDEKNAFALLERLLSARPQDPNALNTLGYTLANANRSLDRAWDLINQALALSPQSPEIMDSMGWVEYRRGRFKEAQRHLERAYVALPIAEVAAHLGEVYWALGEKDKAKAIWQKALANEPDAVLQDTVQRLMPQLKP